MIYLKTPYVIEGCLFTLGFNKALKRKVIVIYNRKFYKKSSSEELMLLAKRNKRIVIYSFENFFVKRSTFKIKVNIINPQNINEQTFWIPRVKESLKDRLGVIFTLSVKRIDIINIMLNPLNTKIEVSMKKKKIAIEKSNTFNESLTFLNDELSRIKINK
ncbi:MAG: hypothetical protein ACPGVD_06885 [Flavobacteriales bacterium]